MLEKDIEKAVKEYARSKGFLAYKFTSPGHSFVPDGLFISPKGGVFFVEFKREGGKPTPGQLREHTRINEHKICVYVVDSIPKGKGVVDAFLKLEGSA